MGLIRLLMFAVVGLLAYTIYKRVLGGPSRTPVNMDDERLGRLVQDPQCLVYVDSQDAVHRKVKGGDLFFCSKECAEEYLQETPRE